MKSNFSEPKPKNNNMNELAPAIVKPSALAVMASRFNVDPRKLHDTLKATVFKSASDEELLALVVVANEYGLNPLTKEIYAFPAKGGGIVPVVSVDGWNNLANSHPQMDGMEFEFDHGEKGELISCTCVIYRKDRSKPIKVTEYLSECKRQTDPWKMEHRMLRHKALIQCSRVAFGFSGVVDEDEVPAMRDVTPVQNAVVPVVKELEQPKRQRAVREDPKPIDPNRTPHQRLADSIDANGITWAQVANAATEGGLFLDAEAELASQPEDVVLEIMSVWPQLVASVKGGAK
jgi:phage recombination protein Bet